MCLVFDGPSINANDIAVLTMFPIVPFIRIPIKSSATTKENEAKESMPCASRLKQQLACCLPGLKHCVGL